jgi:hypothetical protein
VFTNFKQGHTGQLAFITLLLNFGGTVARMFTTLQVGPESVDVMDNRRRLSRSLCLW